MGCGWAVSWNWSGTVVGVYAVRTQALPSGSATFTFGFGERGETNEEAFPYAPVAQLNGTVNGTEPTRFTWELPLALLPGSAQGGNLTDTFAETFFQEQAGTTLTWSQADRGPDCEGFEDVCEIFGRDFALPSPPRPLEPPEPEPVENATALPETNATPDEALGTTDLPASTAAEDGNAVLIWGIAGGGVLLGLVGLVAGVVLLGGRQREGPRRRGKRGLTRLRARAKEKRMAEAGLEATAGGASTGTSAEPRYRFVRQLPPGSFGTTWVAHDTTMDRPVAVKRLHPRWQRDAKVQAAFLREARLAGQLDHPNIVTVHDIVEIDGASVIVMEYVAGGSLEERLSKGPLPVAEAVRITDEVLAGLARVHKAGIFHRDLKPANILLTPDGHAKIADFGVAHAPAGTLLRLSSTGEQPGTPLYMAPEQVHGAPAKAAADLFAVGAILHEMLTGRHYLDPLPRSPFELQRAIAEGTVRLARGVPDALEPFLRRALAKEPADRFESAHAMRRALREALRPG